MHKNFVGRAQEIDFGLFFKTLIFSFGRQFPDRKTEKTIFPAVLGSFTLQNASFSQDRSQEAVPNMQDEKSVSESRMSSMLPQGDGRHFAHLLG